MSRGYTGISFPFKIGNRGGVVMSTTNRYEVPHIIESMEQILGTHKRERTMEKNFGSDLDLQIFEPNEPVTHNIIKYQIVQALKEFEPRVEVKEEDIDIRAEGESIYATINFTVLRYQSNYKATILLGGEE